MTALMTWLTPAAGPTRDEPTATIDRLAAELDAPRFQPHVTVLVTLDTAKDAAARTLTSLVAEVPPLKLTFTTIGHDETCFRSLYQHAAPSAQFQALQEAGQRAFALDRLPPAPHHLSLLYSDLTEGHKRPIIDNLSVSLPLTVCFDAVELWGARFPRGPQLVPRCADSAPGCTNSMIRNMRGMTANCFASAGPRSDPPRYGPRAGLLLL